MNPIQQAMTAGAPENPMTAGARPANLPPETLAQLVAALRQAMAQRRPMGRQFHFNPGPPPAPTPMSNGIDPQYLRQLMAQSM